MAVTPTADLPAAWRDHAARLRPFAPSAAHAFDVAAAQLERALTEADETLLTLGEAARASGYSSDHLGRLVRAGRIPNAGRPYAPRIRRRDLPRRARAAVADGAQAAYDAGADARKLVSRRKGGPHGLA
jgi:hypothetical protein